MILTLLNKLRREVYKSLSKLCLKQARVNYFGLSLKVPIIHGIGTGFLVPADKWMSDCLSVFLQQKQGAVVDVGINIGLYMVKLKALDNSREYIGFEPNSVCNFYTQELIRANDFKNVSVYPFALCEKKELRTFYVRRKADKMGSLNEYARFEEKDKFTFNLVTFAADEVFELLSPAAICSFKIDVEGAELEVLKGLVNTIAKYKPYLFCEIWQLPQSDHPTYSEKHSRLVEICALMNKISYKILGISRKSSADIEVLTSADDFTGKHRPDYILVHDSEVEPLKQKLASI